jgi:GH24 family phage-related lysozyme (muramidase)
MFDRRTMLVGLAACAVARQAGAKQATDIDALIAEVESNNANFPGASGQIEAKELLRSTFAAAQPNQGKSSRTVGSRAVRMIAAFEVSNKTRYENQYRRPMWPGKDSGVTIGIGYDLGYSAPLTFDEDWRGYMSDSDRALLHQVLGRKRAAARAAIAAVQAVEVAYDDAHRQFVEQTLPKYTAQTEWALENTALLPNDCMGALVSLTFNRGPSYLSKANEDHEGRYREMRQIRTLMHAKDFAAIPQQIRAMKRLWQAGSDVGGLVPRRETEATLFETGLQRS